MAKSRKTATKNSADLLPRFARFHRNNPEIYVLFKRFARMLISRGVNKTSAWLIMNRIRWEIEVETYGDVFKICNDYFAPYARMFLLEHPEHAGLFRTKRMKAGNEPKPRFLRSLLRHSKR